MRAYYVAAFFLIFNMMLSLVSLFGFGKISGDEKIQDLLKEEVKSKAEYNPSLFPFGDWISAMNKFAKVFGYVFVDGVTVINTLDKIGVPSPIKEMFASVSWISYVAAFLAFLGRNPES